MTSTAAIAHLRRLAAALARIPDTAWFAEAFALYEAGAEDGMTLDRALGLVPSRGGEPWWAAERRSQRDAAIREVHAKHFADLGVTNAARQIAMRARRLQAIKRNREERMSAAGDDLLNEALNTGVPFPQVRQIQTIIRNEK